MNASSVAGLRPGRTILALLILLALAAIPARAGDGVWTPVGPPGTGSSLAIAQELVLDPFSSFALYLLDRGEDASGLWKSNDGGDLWISINAGLGTSFVRSLVADPFTPGTLYILLGESVFKSTDGGGTWTEAFHGTPGDALFFDRIVADPAVPGTLWSFYSSDGAVFRSEDGGATWTVLGSAGGGPAGDLAFDPLNSDVLFRSRNGGDTWEPINAGLPLLDVRVLEVDPGTPGGLFAGTGGAGIWAGRF